MTMSVSYFLNKKNPKLPIQLLIPVVWVGNVKKNLRLTTVVL